MITNINSQCVFCVCIHSSVVANAVKEKLLQLWPPLTDKPVIWQLLIPL